MAGNQQDEQRLALFIDFENIAIGVRDAHYRKFDVNLVLERLLEKGKLLVKKAYADWSRYSDYKRAFHEAAIELIEIPQKSIGGKNSADIRLVVDAMDMSFQKEHVNSFVIASGDSDFSPLVTKLKENDKYVIGLGVKNSTSDLLIENCDEFIFYEDLVRVQQRPLPMASGGLPEKLQECFSLLVDSVVALQRENKEVLWGSMVKETMKRKRPSFNETYYGFRTFSHLLEDAQRRGVVVLRRDQKSGSYVVEDLGSASTATVARSETGSAAVAAPRPVEASVSSLAASAVNGNAVVAENPEGTIGPRGGVRRRRGRGRRGRGTSTLAAGAFMDGAHNGAHDEGSDADDHEDMEDDLHSGDEGQPSGAPQIAAPPAEHAEHASGSPADAAPPQEPGRPAFSLFSWIRRDPAPEPEHSPGTERKPEGEE